MGRLIQRSRPRQPDVDPEPEGEQGSRTKSQRSMDSEECINDATINVGEVRAAVASPDTSEAGRLKHCFRMATADL